MGTYRESRSIIISIRITSIRISSGAASLCGPLQQESQSPLQPHRGYSGLLQISKGPDRCLLHAVRRWSMSATPAQLHTVGSNAARLLKIQGRGGEGRGEHNGRGECSQTYSHHRAIILPYTIKYSVKSEKYLHILHMYSDNSSCISYTQYIVQDSKVV